MVWVSPFKAPACISRWHGLRCPYSLLCLLAAACGRLTVPPLAAAWCSVKTREMWFHHMGNCEELCSCLHESDDVVFGLSLLGMCDYSVYHASRLADHLAGEVRALCLFVALLLVVHSKACGCSLMSETMVYTRLPYFVLQISC